MVGRCGKKGFAWADGHRAITRTVVVGVVIGGGHLDVVQPQKIGKAADEMAGQLWRAGAGAAKCLVQEAQPESRFRVAPQ